MHVTWCSGRSPNDDSALIIGQPQYLLTIHGNSPTPARMIRAGVNPRKKEANSGIRYVNERRGVPGKAASDPTWRVIPRQTVWFKNSVCHAGLSRGLQPWELRPPERGFRLLFRKAKPLLGCPRCTPKPGDLHCPPNEMSTTTATAVVW